MTRARKATPPTRRSAPLVRLFGFCAVAVVLASPAAAEVPEDAPVGPPSDLVCRAAMAAIHGRDPEILTATEHEDGVLAVAFTHRDGTPWTTRCVVEEDRVRWAVGDGRWRDDKFDSVVRWEIDETRIFVTETHHDRSTTFWQFPLSRFGE